MVVFLGIRGVITPPKVSIPKVNGVTSRRTTSLTSPRITPPWIAAPTETASSGLTDWFGFLPLFKRVTRSTTAGILVEPPTKIISSISETESFASAKAFSNGVRQRSIKSAVKSWNLALVRVVSKLTGAPSLKPM